MMARTKKWHGHTEVELRKRWGREEVFVHGKVTSTNDVAADLAEKDARAGTIILASEQSAGRGRDGKTWHSGEGGLYVSMVLRPENLVMPSPITILAGLAIVMELDRGFPGLEPRLKWPNDLYVNDRKAGGVLTEATWTGPSPRHLVIGVGINVGPLTGELPRDVAVAHSTLDEALGTDVPIVEVADAVIRGLDSVENPPPAIPPALLGRLDSYDWLRDRRVRLRSAGGEDEPVRGMCVGIAPDGALLFRPDRGALRRVSTATVEVE
jgi:BirA family biotin operon repressor/biotin-[acetyl-CoA-carboxylase] ligase